MELDYAAEYHTTSEHLLPLSLSFLLWALKKVLLSGTISPVPWMPDCPPPQGNSYKSAFPLPTAGSGARTEQWQGCCLEGVRSNT